MPFNVPTLRQLIKTGEQDIEIELDEKLPPVGVERALNTSFSGAVRDVYDYQSWIADQVVPSPKSDDQTIIDTASTEGVIRKAATYATGKAVFKGSQPIPLNTEMLARNGNGYHVITASAPANGVQTVTIQADDVGASGNLDADAQLTLVSPIPGVESTGVVDGNGLTGGTDIEPISELLDRLLFRKRNPPVGGAVHDYVIWAREMAGVSRAWAWDAWHGPGTVGLAWVYDSRTDITPTAADRAAMNEYLFRHADPATGNFVGKPGGIEVWIISLTLKPIGPAIKLVPDSAETRRATLANLNALQRTLSPGSTLLLSSLRTAIGTATGVTDYTLNINSDITSASGELITIGDVTWLTA
ncbi:baseplate J/gp47 family protein [Serratia marcescens]|uniref:baseplate J/gp47 family protein n=1 Tax=Serratia sp. LACPHL-BACT-2024-00286 TaxID=3366399 RepID=UPI0018D5ECB4|nr:baseplate J/gp47 family protein [Serratia marcescens]MBN5409399.1 baseplate J/gp47 family protein [Serratia marcescens]HEJ7192125.1 baseplate J/gp47 family protein [Serratia marcescens]